MMEAQAAEWGIYSTHRALCVCPCAVSEGACMAALAAAAEPGRPFQSGGSNRARARLRAAAAAWRRVLGQWPGTCKPAPFHLPWDVSPPWTGRGWVTARWPSWSPGGRVAFSRLDTYHHQPPACWAAWPP